MLAINGARAAACVEYNVNGVIVNAGGTAAGIGQVYALAKQMGFKTTGIVCWESQKWENQPQKLPFSQTANGVVGKMKANGMN
uniref:Uncharacterized protein n=1 Tax=Ditylenchus dipsaci TaxID=166011 RepID=A0A915D630_9BILA